MILVTSNEHKIREIAGILNPEIDFRVKKIEYAEIRSEDPGEIAATAAKQLADEFGQPVIVEDSGIFINALNDFPGTFSKTITKKIGLQGYIRLMDGIRDRSCEYRSAVGYCEPGQQPHIFIGVESGTVSDAIKGDKGWGHDPIFIPSGNTLTYAESGRPAGCAKFRTESVSKLKEFLLSRQKLQTVEQ